MRRGKDDPKTELTKYGTGKECGTQGGRSGGMMRFGGGKPKKQTGRRVGEWQTLITRRI